MSHCQSRKSTDLELFSNENRALFERGSLVLLFQETDFAVIVSLGDGGAKPEVKRFERLGYIAVSVHGDVAVTIDIFVGEPLFLPGRDERAVVEVENELILSPLDCFHIEGLERHIRTENFGKRKQILGLLHVFLINCKAVETATTSHCLARDRFKVDASLFGLVHHESHPCGAVLYGTPVYVHLLVVDSDWLVLDLGHVFLLAM